MGFSLSMRSPGIDHPTTCARNRTLRESGRACVMNAAHYCSVLAMIRSHQTHEAGSGSSDQSCTDQLSFDAYPWSYAGKHSAQLDRMKSEGWVEEHEYVWKCRAVSVVPDGYAYSGSVIDFLLRDWVTVCLARHAESRCHSTGAMLGKSDNPRRRRTT